jgi:hypothetical protein
MGRLAHGIHAKSAPQAYRAGDKGQRAMRLTQQLSKPGLWHVSPSLPLIRTPWHHLSSYQSLVFGMYRQACSSYALLGTTSAATNARFLACIASACSSYALLGTTSAAIEALVPSMYRQRLQLIRTPWHPLVSYLHVSHRRSSNCFETVVLWTCRF